MKEGRFIPMVIALGLVSWLGCAKPVSQDDLIREAVELRVGQWRQAQLKDCRDRALDRADKYVDSLLLAISLTTRLATIPKPARPDRPGRPVFREKPDTVVIRRAPDAGQ